MIVSLPMTGDTSLIRILKAGSRSVCHRLESAFPQRSISFSQNIQTFSATRLDARFSGSINETRRVRLRSANAESRQAIAASVAAVVPLPAQEGATDLYFIASIHVSLHGQAALTGKTARILSDYGP